MICNICNHKLPDDSEFCQYCGNKIADFIAPEIANDHFDDVENMSDREAMNLIVPTQVRAKKEAHDANNQSRSNTEANDNFGVQKAQTVKKTSKIESSKLDIINIFVLLLTIILSGVGTNSSYNEEMFAAIFLIGIITLILKIIAVAKFKNHILFTSIISGALLIMTICSLATEDEEIGPWVCIFSLYIFICELCKLIKFCIEKYHGSQNYKMKCYKKINLINDYLEKGVITQEEFEETRKQIISKIR